jgi:hypothetical protein
LAASAGVIAGVDIGSWVEQSLDLISGHTAAVIVATVGHGWPADIS